MSDIQMQDSQNSQTQAFKGLEWLIDEIERSLTSAFSELEAFTQDTDDETKIRFCLSHLHQISGPFKILECQGSMLLAEEMEALTQSIIDRKVSNIHEACEILVQAIIRLPIYLRQVLATREDRPEALILLLNDLRAAQGRSLLSEGILFTPDLSTIENKKDRQLRVNTNPKALIDLIKRLRQIYQISLIKIIKEDDLPKHYLNLKKVFQRMQEVCVDTWREELWSISQEILDLVSDRQIDFTMALKKLFRVLDTQIKVVISDVETDKASEIDTGLIKNLLYYLMTVKPGNKKQQEQWEKYALANALPAGVVDPESNRLTPRYDPLVVRALVSAIQGELANVRSALERFSIEGGMSSEDVCKTLPILTNMADSLALVGQGKLRDAIKDIRQNLDDTFSGSLGVDDEQVIAAVQKLTEVEVTLNAWAVSPEKFSGVIDVDCAENNYEFDNASAILLSEARTGIERIKESVVEFINSQWDLDLLRPVPEMFKELSGALKMIQLDRAAAVIQGCEIYVQKTLISEQPQIEWHALDTFADAITIVEYYLEQTGSIEDLDQDSILKAAEESIESLLEGFIADEAKEDLSLLGSLEPIKNLEPIKSLEPNNSLSAASPELVNSSEPSNSLEPGDSLEQGDSPEPDAVPANVPEQIPTEPVAKTAEDEEFDAEIVEIFVEEAAEVLAALRSKLPEWQKHPDSTEALTVIRRCFHTLKGSGRMVGATDIGDLGWSVESMLNRILDGRISGGSSAQGVVELSIERMPILVEAFAAKQPQPNPQISQQIIDAAEQLAKGESINELPNTDLSQQVEEALLDGSEDQPLTEPNETPSDKLRVEQLEPINVNDLGEELNSQPVTEPQAPLIEELSQEESEEEILLDIFVNEAKGHLRTIDHYLIQTRALAPMHQPPTSDLQRALHTLKGTAEMADFKALSQLVSPLDEFVKELHNHQISVDEDIMYLINDGVTFVRSLLEKMVTEDDSDNQNTEVEGLGLFFARLAELREKFVGAILRAEEGRDNGPSFVAVKKLMAYGLRAIQDYGVLLQQVRSDTGSTEAVYQQFIDELEEIQTTTVDLPAITELAGLMAEVYRRSQADSNKISKDTLELLEYSHEILLNLFDMFAADQDLSPLAEAHIQQLKNLISQLPEPAIEETPVPVDEPSVLQEPLAQEEPSVEEEPSAEEELLAEEEFLAQEGPLLELESSLEEPLAQEEASASKEPAANKAQPAAIKSWMEDDLDQEIVGIFVEEAEDIISNLEETLHAWQNSPKQAEFGDQLKRDLHTLKGGAQMAGFNALGQYTHDFESTIDGTNEYNDAFFNRLATSQEWLSRSYDIARRIAAGDTATDVQQQIVDLEAFIHQPQPMVDIEAIATEQQDKEQDKALQGELEPESADLKTSNRGPSAQPPVLIEKRDFSADLENLSRHAPPSDRPFGTQGEIKEVVRIGAETLDTLVNLSGENIIFRGRVEEQVSDFNHSLDEMDATILRLQEQVRRLGTETEAQIDYRREQIEASGESANFDPLEMDRYSHLQQLSGSLVESASDLYDLKETLVDKLVGTESLLVHQSRINTDLQEGLMQTRMVPFSRIVPRLRRIVRQVSQEVGKEVQLKMENIHGEMDRTVLDRIVAPLEHLIRNAVDHGIETQAQRKKAHKSATGTIAVTTYRQGGGIVIHLADDGAGLDMSRIRDLAIEKELMQKDAPLSDHEVAKFIFHPGFSTSDAVSEISGRGVGLDVVSSEVRQLGGSVDIESSPGRGTQFTVTLPFTLSVNRALMINVTGDHYALSLNSIDGVHFISPEKLADVVAEGGIISYAGRDYALQHLGALLSAEANIDIVTPMASLTESVPIVLFHSDNRYFAAQVDEIVGTQEIVVKNLGAQFSTVPGLGGATILSDGRVVVIIDLNELARVAISEGSLISQDAETAAEKALTQETSKVDHAADEATYVLVVDDSVTVRKVTSRILKRQGYRVATAKDGIEALKAMQEEIPAVMLLDIEMPRMDGFEVATRVRASETLKNIPILMITSRTGDKHRQRAMELGVDRYMGKPYQEDELLGTIDELLASRST